MNEADVLKRITVNPKIFGGKPIIRGRRLAVEHVHGGSVGTHVVWAHDGVVKVGQVGHVADPADLGRPRHGGVGRRAPARGPGPSRLTPP